MPAANRLLLYPGVALLLAGCSTVTPEQAFQPVQNDVQTLAGRRVMWNQGTTDDQKVEAEIKKALESPIGADTAAQIALLNNPDLQATFEEIGISQADLVQAGLLKNPAFFGSWRFPSTPPMLMNPEYSLVEEFMSIALMPMRLKIAKTNLEATESRVTHEVIKLINEVRIAFYEYQAELQLEKRFKLIINADQAAADLAKSQHDAGNITDADLLNQQAQLSDAELALTNAQKRKVREREKLDQLMGLQTEEVNWTVLPNLPDLPEHEISLEKLEQLALKQRRDLIAQRKQVDSIGQMLALKTNTRFLPVTLSIGVDTERDTGGQRVTGPRIDAELPIFDQGQGEIAKLSAQYRQACKQLQAMAVRVCSQVREARDTLKIDRQQVDYYRKTVVPVNRQAVNQTLLQFNAMRVNTYDLFLTKERELNIERDYIEAWRDYWITRVQLEDAVGGSLGPVTPTRNL